MSRVFASPPTPGSLPPACAFPHAAVSVASISSGRVFASTQHLCGVEWLHRRTQKKVAALSNNNKTVE